ncbi:DNA polymerase III subunit alpha [[Mycoplasma] cavipharyngis]|uniref:DNA polymerase III subunit alpha n=1 Tax=[Mycoplasma] cavipharyngis TaxID=92757 RepID=UPI003704BAD8
MPFLPSIYNVSQYSLLSSSLKIEQIIQHAITHQHTSVVITDYKNMFGYIEFYNQAIKNNLKPIFGLVINYQNQAELILLAKNKNGFNNLIKISSHDQFDLQWLTDLVVIVSEGTFENDQLDVYYADHPTSPKRIYLRKNLFFNQEDYQTYCAMIAIKNNTTLEQELINQNYLTKNYLNQEDLIDLNDLGVQNLFQVLNQCQSFSLNQKLQILNFPTPNKISAENYLINLAKFGLEKIVFQNKKLTIAQKEKYIQRLNYELTIINQMQFANYFLIVHDYVSFAKNQGIYVGPGRGSVAGSLVAYVLGITLVDPLVYNLYFERFLNPARTNMPDIDIDFMDTRREEVIQYLFEKYSNDYVAQIITFQTIKARSAIRDIGRILAIDLKTVDQIAKTIPLAYNENLALAIKEVKALEIYYKLYPKLFNLALKIINTPRQISIHAAGVVLSNQKFGEKIPVIKNAANLNLTQYSMEYLEDVGLMKMDLLGLRNLSLISDVIKLIHHHKNEIIFIETIALDDPKVFASLLTHGTTGIFQLESEGMTKLTMQFKPKTIEDLSLISALFRPGPQKHINEFLKCRFNQQKNPPLHPRLSQILDQTYGFIVYQEQLIAVVVAVTNCDLAQADLFRWSIAKKEEAKLIALKDQFFQQGLKNDYDQKSLEKIWDFIYQFANYGFNHSHSISYAIVSYWLAWLRYYYPLEFYCMLLSSTGDINLCINQIQALNYVVLPPDINYSQADFVINNNQIYFGFSAIKGLGSESIKKILKIKKMMKNQLFVDLNDTLLHLLKNGINPSILKILNHAGCFNQLFTSGQNNLYVDYLIENLTKPAFQLKLENNLMDHMEYPIMTQEAKIKYNEYQQNLLGYSFQDHKVKNFRTKTKIQTKLNQLVNQKTIYEDYLVVIENVKEAKTKNNKSMLWVYVSDESQNGKRYPYFGHNQNLFLEANLTKEVCILTFESKNKDRIRIKEIKKIIHE